MPVTSREEANQEEMSLKVVLPILLWSVSLSTAWEQRPFLPLEPPKSLLSPEFSAFASKILETWGVPGLSVGIISIKEGIPEVEFQSFGTMGNDRNVTEETLFGIASNSKAFTAAAVGTFVEEGLLNWTSKVSEVIPVFSLRDEYASKKLSVIDMLSHQSGLPRHDSSYQVGGLHEDFVRRMKYLRPSAEFRQTWQYNNQMFITGAYLASLLSGTPFTTYVTDRIIKPLNMTSTTYLPTTKGFENQVSASYVSLPNMSTVEIPYGFNFTFDGIQTAAGAGGVVSNAKDLLKWVELLMTQRRLSRNESEPSRVNFSSILLPETIAEMTKAHSIMERENMYPDASGMTYGLGLRMLMYQGAELIFHGGSLPGFGTQIAWSSTHGVGVVALCNTADTGNAVSDIVSYRAMEDLIGLEHIDWNQRYLKRLTEANVKKADIISNVSRHVQEFDKTEGLASGVLVDQIYGHYFDRGYGNVTACPSSLSSFRQTKRSLVPSSCEPFLTKVEAAEPVTPVPPPLLNNTFILIIPGYFGLSHVSFYRVKGDKFAGVAAERFGATKTRDREILAYEWGNEVFATFIEGLGGGIQTVEVSGVWGAGPEIEKLEKKEGLQVEVVFQKVEDPDWGME